MTLRLNFGHWIFIAWMGCVALSYKAQAEVVAEGKDISLVQIVELESHVGFYFENEIRHSVYVGVVNYDRKEERSLIDFKNDRIIAFGFEKKAGEKVRTMTFFGISPEGTIAGWVYEFVTSSCETKESRADFTIRNSKTLEIDAIDPSGSYCRKGRPLYGEILEAEDRETFGGAIFKVDYSVPGFGKAYRDETGLIWSRLQLDNFGKPIYTTFANAVEQCRSIGGRLPDFKDVTRFSRAITDFEHPIQREDGIVIFPSKPFTARSLALSRDINDFGYESKIQEIIPGLSSMLMNNHSLFTSDGAVYWSAREGKNRIEDYVSGSVGIVCVQEKLD